MGTSSSDHPTPSGRDTLPGALEVSADGREIAPVSNGLSAQKQFVLVLALTIAIASIANHLIASLLGLGVVAQYRRIGPTTGPQVYCVGSSLLQYSLDWPGISGLIGQGIEHTNVAGSTPEIWDIFQRDAENVDTTIIGISVHDLNEYRVSEGLAYIVPLSQTIEDLVASHATWQISHRALSQYALMYLRKLFPTAGNSDPLLVGLRGIARRQLSLSGAQEDRAIVLALPKGPVLDFGKDFAKLSDMPHDQMLRRLSLLRTDNLGLYSFNGPKQIALRRIMERARHHGRVVLLVLPVSDVYVKEFLTPMIMKDFEDAITEARRYVPDATIIRLDREPGLQSDDHFVDFVHMNSDGRAIATRIFTEQIQLHPSPDQHSNDDKRP